MGMRLVEGCAKPTNRKGVHVQHRVSQSMIAAVAGFVLTMAAGFGWAQEAATDGASGDRRAAAGLVADQMEDLARQVLAMGDKSDTDRLVMASMLLERATEAAPWRSELWRLRVEAAGMMEDRDAQIEALAGYLKAEPKDDAAQLRLIDLLLSRKQTAEERLAGYEKMVSGAMAKQLSAPLRSRLASRAALLARESGEQERYSKLLKLAVTLDRTNRGAMAEVYRVLVTRPEGSSELERAQALVLLHAADPVNAEVRRQVGGLLTRCGQYEAAVRWYISAHALNEAQRLGPPPLDDVGDWATAMWASGHAKPAVGLIGSLREAIKQQAEAARQAGKPAPEDPRLPARLLAIETAVADAAGDTEAADKAFDRLVGGLAEAAAATPDDAELLTQVIWARLMFNRKLEAVDAMVARLGELVKADDVRLSRLKGWAAYRGGDEAAARGLLAPCAERDELCALGMGMLTAADDAEKSAQIAMLRGVFERAPGSIAGVMAAERMAELGARPQSSEEGERIGRLVAQVPDELRDLAVDGKRTLRVRVDSARALVAFGEPIEVTVSVQNATHTPLSLGGDGTIPSTMFVVPQVTIGNEEARVLPPQVVDLGRRLVLAPGEQVAVTVHLGGLPLTALLRSRPDVPVTVKAVCVLNPMLVKGGLTPGPMGMAVTSRSVTSGGRAITPEAAAQHTAKLNGPDRADAMKSAAWMARLVAMTAESDPATATKLVDALSARYATMDALQQAYVVGFLGGGEASRKALAPIIDAAVNSEDQTVQFTLLLTLVDKKDSTVLESALRRKGTAVGRFAEHLRTAWEQMEEAKKKAAEEGGAKGDAAGDEKPAVEPVK